jgi:putative ABC transport system permease protein
MLARNKGFAAIAILALALGIGPNVAIFSIIWATFLAPLPYANPKQLVVVWSHYKGERNPTLAKDYAEWAAADKTFQRLDFQSWNARHLTNADHSQDETSGLLTTPGFYTKDFGLRMAMGRDFLPDEGTPGKDHLAIVTHRLWTTRYNSDPQIIGKPILIDDEPYTVVGVLPEGPMDKVEGTQFVVPYIPKAGVPSNEYGNVFARLKPGVTLAQAQAEIAAIDARLAAQRDGTDPKSWSVSVEQLKNDWLDPKLMRNMWLLLAAVGLVLLIACANVANLLLARGSARRQELALRSAMGATRRQVFAQLLTESLTLAVVGGGIGVVLGWAIMKLAMAILPLEKQVAEAVVGLNVPVLCFAIGVTLMGGVLFGCAPALQAAKVNLSETLKQGSRAISGRNRSGTQAVLVTVEFALALTLLAGAGLALHSFWNLSRIDLGVRTDHVLTGSLQPKSTAHQGRPTFPSPEQIAANERQMVEKLRAVPGVEDVALTTGIPLQGAGSFPFSIAGQPTDPKQQPVADLQALTPGFFSTFGVRLVKGRFLNDADTLGRPMAVVVNESFVRRYLEHTDPMTTQLLLGIPQPGQNKLGPPITFQVVGVFHDIHNDKLADAAQPQMFVSLGQIPWPFVGLAVRTAVDPGAVTSSIRSTLAEVAPNVALIRVQTMQEVVEDQMTGDRFGMVLFAGFAGVALLLAALGIYGVMSFAVAQRTHEIGLRMALGAQKNEVVGMIVRGGMRMAVPGMAIGLVGVFVLGRLMHSTLYGVGAVDYASTLLVAAVLFGVGVFASWLPARRSAQVDPMIALRDE